MRRFFAPFEPAKDLVVYPAAVSMSSNSASSFLQPPVLAGRVTLGLSLFLLLEGSWGLASPVVLGIFTTNRAHAIIHLVLGVIGLLAWRKGFTKSYLGFVGSLLIVVAFLWFLPPTRSVPAGLLRVNLAVAIFNLLVGAGAIFVAATARTVRRVS